MRLWRWSKPQRAFSVETRLRFPSASPEQGPIRLVMQRSQGLVELAGGSLFRGAVRVGFGTDLNRLTVSADDPGEGQGDQAAIPTPEANRRSGGESDGVDGGLGNAGEGDDAALRHSGGASGTVDQNRGRGSFPDLSDEPAQSGGATSGTRASGGLGVSECKQSRLDQVAVPASADGHAISHVAIEPSAGEHRLMEKSGELSRGIVTAGTAAPAGLSGIVADYFHSPRGSQESQGPRRDATEASQPEAANAALGELRPCIAWLLRRLRGRIGLAHRNGRLGYSFEYRSQFLAGRSLADVGGIA
jgi:hypothetical protein